MKDFIKQLRSSFLGDVLDASWSAGKPVNIFPEPFVKHGFARPAIPPTAFQPELDARNYIHELTLMLNSEGRDHGNKYSSAWLQFSFPFCSTPHSEEMDLSLARTLIDDINRYTPALIHVSGANIMRYAYLDEIVGKLGRSPFQKKYHLKLYDWDTSALIHLINQKQTTVALYISFPADPDKITCYLRDLSDQKLIKKLEFNLIVSDSDELKAATELVETLCLLNVFFKPLLTGVNLDFFKENVFVSREEILAARPDQQQILSRISLNDYDFGKFTILPRGEVFANVNDPKVGDANQHNLMQLVIRELDNGISWRRNRGEVPPCSACRYRFLCPPVSSYEIYLKRFNFCHVYPNQEGS